MQAERITQALNFPMGPILKRYMEEHKVPKKTAKLHEREIKRYLALCASHPGGGWPMVGTIDDLWHTFIIFTEEYHEFCSLVGRSYIHHRPATGGEDVGEMESRYKKFLKQYRKTFGQRPPASIWPSGLKMSDCMEHCDVEPRDCMARYSHCTERKKEETHCDIPSRDCMGKMHCGDSDSQ